MIVKKDSKKENQSTLDNAVAKTAGFQNLNVDADFNLEKELEDLTDSLNAQISEPDYEPEVEEVLEASVNSGRVVNGSSKLSSKGGAILSNNVVRNVGLDNNSDYEFAEVVVQKTIAPAPRYILGWSWAETFPGVQFAKDVVAKIPYPVALSLSESKLVTITRLLRRKS